MRWIHELAPIVTAEPELGSPAAFSEDEFVGLWGDMYALLIRLNYWRREEIIFPDQSTGRHASLDKQRLLGELGMSTDAVSLVERLPYPRLGSRGDRQIYVEAQTLSYLDEHDIKACRDPHGMAGSRPRAGESPVNGLYLLALDVALAIPYEGEGATWILDIKHSKSTPGICWHA